MEYLMTYGWALLVIVIVIAVLMFIRPFGAPESCVFQQPGFTCEGPRVVASTSGGMLYVIVSNAQQKAINQVEIACAKGAALPAPSDYKSVTTGKVAHSEKITSAGQANCGADLKAGEDFTGKLYLKYCYVDEKCGTGAGEMPPKVASANLITRVQ